MPWLAAACHDKDHGDAIGHSAATARAMIALMACAMRLLAMAAYYSTMTRAMTIPSRQGPRQAPRQVLWQAPRQYPRQAPRKILRQAPKAISTASPMKKYTGSPTARSMVVSTAIPTIRSTGSPTAISTASLTEKSTVIPAASAVASYGIAVRQGHKRLARPPDLTRTWPRPQNAVIRAHPVP